MGLKEAKIKSMSREDFKNNDYIDKLVDELNEKAYALFLPAWGNVSGL